MTGVSHEQMHAIERAGQQGTNDTDRSKLRVLPKQPIPTAEGCWGSATTRDWQQTLSPVDQGVGMGALDEGSPVRIVVGILLGVRRPEIVLLPALPPCRHPQILRRHSSCLLLTSDQ